MPRMPSFQANWAHSRGIVRTSRCPVLFWATASLLEEVRVLPAVDRDSECFRSPACPFPACFSFIESSAYWVGGTVADLSRSACCPCGWCCTDTYGCNRLAARVLRLPLPMAMGGTGRRGPWLNDHLRSDVERWESAILLTCCISLGPWNCKDISISYWC